MIKENTGETKMAHSIKDISKQTTLSQAFLRNEIRAGRLKVKKFGRRVLVLTEDLQQYLGKETRTA